MLGADLRGADLWSADLIEANLANSRFDGACLAGVRFHNAELCNCSFRNSMMASTAFVNSDLSDCDFRNTKFNNANLRGAYLLSAKLYGAGLTDADLVGADLSRTEPWKATLFAPGHGVSGQHEQDRAEKPIGSVANLIDECRKLKEGCPRRVLYFRGESRNTWKLEPYLMRNAKWRVKEGDMLLDLLTRRPGEFETARSALSQWMLAQHHGLPTRLLDVTRNPLVALFNACKNDQDEPGRVHVFSVPKPLIKTFNSDVIRVIANLAKLPLVQQNEILGKLEPFDGIDEGCLRPHSRIMQQLYHSIRLERPAFEKKIDPRDFFRVFVVEPQQLFARIRAQSGAFLVSAFHERFEREEILKENSGIPIYDHNRFTVAEKDRINEDLRLLNVTEETLFPDLDRAAQAVAAQAVS